MISLGEKLINIPDKFCIKRTHLAVSYFCKTDIPKMTQYNLNDTAYCIRTHVGPSWQWAGNINHLSMDPMCLLILMSHRGGGRDDLWLVLGRAGNLLKSIERL